MTRLLARAVLFVVIAAAVFASWPIWLRLAAVLGFMFGMDWLMRKAGWNA